eukprot:1364229-Alexandrium_andersonii.AAC.1
MSASLVGSEMCIRDSLFSAPDICGGIPKLFYVANFAGPIAGNVASPVSYTHLTLPTICSV